MNRIAAFLILVIMGAGSIAAQTVIPANDPSIQYFGRWDMSNPAYPTHGWPGVSVAAVFQGTSIGVVTDDNACWYNVFIDDSLVRIFQGTVYGSHTYTLASGLKDTVHTILFELRSETSWTKFGFYGFVLDNGKSLVAPPAAPVRKIEFIGDSYTSASGNEWTQSTSAPNDSYSNLHLGFGPIIARHYGAQYMMTSRGGIGLVHDYLGNYANNLPSFYDRTFFYSQNPKWDFSKWVPNLVVICLGLNDYSGWGGYSGPVSDQCALYYRTRYHHFIDTVTGLYKGAKILCVSPNGINWLIANIQQVVQEENAAGHKNVFYGAFPYYSDAGAYVNSGHPSVATHQKIADALIPFIDTIDAWNPYVGTKAPSLTDLPSSPVTAYSSSYTLTVHTDAFAVMRYSTQDKPYDQMENIFSTTGALTHSVVLSCVNGNTYTYYMRAQDIYGNAMDTSAVITLMTDTTKTPVNWTSLNYDHSGWNKGTAPLGNASDAATQVGSVRTAYYRRIFSIDSLLSSITFNVKIKGRDGAAVYLNGNNIGTYNLSANSGVVYSTLADQAMSLDTVIKFSILNRYSRFLQAGNNVIAVEIHTADASICNILFDSYAFDSWSSSFFYPLGSDWYYYSGGSAPPNQLMTFIPSAVARQKSLLPQKTDLFPSYPNPFNPSATIQYQISSRSAVTLKIYNILGKEVATLVNEQKPAGSYKVQWNADRFASGTYFAVLRAGSFMKSTKLLLLK